MEGRYAPLLRWPAASLDSGVLRGSLRTSHFSFRKMGIFQSELRAKYLVHDPVLCPWKLTNRDRSHCRGARDDDVDRVRDRAQLPW